MLRLETASSGRVHGRFIRALGDTLCLLEQGSERAIPMGDVQGLWQRGSASKTGALLGGLVGAAIPKWHRRYP